MHYGRTSNSKAKNAYKWTTGWSTVSFYRINGTTFLFLLKRKNGTVHIHKIKKSEKKGSVGSRIESRNWSSGWTSAVPFTVGTKRFIFFLKKAGGKVSIRKLNSSGKIGTKVKGYDWSSGWSSVAFYTLNSVTYLILLKK